MEKNNTTLWSNAFERNRCIDDSIRNFEILKTLCFYNSDDEINKAMQAVERIELTISALNEEIDNKKVKVKKNV